MFSKCLVSELAEKIEVGKYFGFLRDICHLPFFSEKKTQNLFPLRSNIFCLLLFS